VARLTKAEILRLLRLLDAELAHEDATAEVYLVGGAVMCLVFGARDSTHDVDAVFRPATLVRQAAARIAARSGAPEHWLNDAVKGLIGTRGDFDVYLELPHLRVFAARAEYLLAMKCVALRLGAEFHDLDDVRYLLRHMNISKANDALDIVTRYFDPSAVPAKARLALEELLGSRNGAA